MIKQFLPKDSNYYKLLNSVNELKNCTVFGLNKGEIIETISNIENTVLLVAPNETKAYEIYDILLRLSNDSYILVNNVDYNPNIKTEANYNYLKVVSKIKNNELKYLVVTPNVFLNKVSPLKSFESLSLKVNTEFNLKALISNLVRMGFKQSDLVDGVGQFSKRGDILDIFAINMDTPVRINFFDNQIESIKFFSVTTQFALSEIGEIHVFTNKLCDEGETQTCSFLSYLQSPSIVFLEPKQIIDSVKEKLSLSDGSTHEKQLFNYNEFVSNFNNQHLISFQNITTANNIFKPECVFNINCEPTINFNLINQVLVDEIVHKYNLGYTIILFLKNSQNLQVLQSKLSEHKVNINIANFVSTCQKNCINLIAKELPYSFCLSLEKIMVMGMGKDVFNKKPGKTVSASITLEALPSKGDFVVHQTHGVGKCLGIMQLDLNGALHDYVLIEYLKGDKLYLPVENVDCISKYIGGEKAPKLNKLGGR